MTTTDADQLGITYPETEGDWFTPNPSETANFISQRHVPLLQDGSYEASPQQHEIVTNFWSKSANMAVTTAEKPDSDSGELSITAKERRRCEQLATLNEWKPGRIYAFYVGVAERRCDGFGLESTDGIAGGRNYAVNCDGDCNKGSWCARGRGGEGGGY